MKIGDMETIREMIRKASVIRLVKVENALIDVLGFVGENDSIKEIIDEIEVELSSRAMEMEQRLTW